jgi:hypothetical protein
MKIYMSEFIELCQVEPEDLDNWGGLKVSDEGLFVLNADASSILTPSEYAALIKGRPTDSTKPAIVFPCNLRQLVEFLDGIGLTGVIDADELDSYLAEEDHDTSQIIPKDESQKVQSTDETSQIVTEAAPQKEQFEVKKNMLRNRSSKLMVEINQAMNKAHDKTDIHSVWGELTKLAEQKTGGMIGFSSEGVQYRGKVYQNTGVPDVFTLKMLRDRMRPKKTKAE